MDSISALPLSIRLDSIRFDSIRFGGLVVTRVYQKLAQLSDFYRSDGKTLEFFRELVGRNSVFDANKIQSNGQLCGQLCNRTTE